MIRLYSAVLLFIPICTYLYLFIATTSGCDAISSEGRCYSCFSSPALYWIAARDKCKEWGGDLATVTSSEENLLMYTTAVSSLCWFGLNDMETEQTWVWVDGSNSTYRNWASTEPNNRYGAENCGTAHTNKYWYDYTCGYSIYCYYCSATG